MRRAARAAARAAHALQPPAPVVAAHQARHASGGDKAKGVLSEFAQSVKSGLESNPELKKQLDELRKSTSGLAEKAREGIAGTAGAAREGLGGAASKASAAVRDSVGDAPAELLKAAKERVPEPAELLKKGRGLFSSLREGLPGAGGTPGAQGEPHAAPGGAAAADAPPADEQSQSRADPPPPPPPPPPPSRLGAALSRARAWATTATASVSHAVRAEVRLAMMDEGDAAAERARERAAAQPGPAPGPVDATSSAVMVTKPVQNAWQRRWGALRDVAAASPLFSPLLSRASAAAAAAAAAGSARAAPVVRATRDAAADLRERWETSDSPLVHRLQDVGDSLKMEETETARALAAIRAAQPDFDMHEFVALVKRDVPPILRAYLGADVAALRGAGLAPELIERLSAMMAVWRAEGTVMDSQILDLSELEVTEIKMLGDHPLVVFSFQIQQINCIRDAAGVVVDGAADDIQSVYYAWAMEQVPPEGLQPVQWRLRDMMVRGFHAIV